MFVFPSAGVHRAAAEADDDGEVFDTDRALVLACAAGGALEVGGDGVVFADDVLFGGRAVFVEVTAEAEDDFFGVEFLAGVVGGAVLCAAAALDAGVGLKAGELGEVFACDKAEIFVADERRDFAEASAREKDGGGAEHEVEVFGVRNDGKEDEDGEGVNPPEGHGGRAGALHRKGGEVGDHQDEDESGNDAGFVRNFLTKPSGAHEEATDKEAEDADGAGGGECGREVGVEATEEAGGIEESQAEADSEVIEGDESEGAESPEDEGVGEAGERALANDLGLAEDFPEEVPDAFTDGSEAEVRIFSGFENAIEDGGESAEKESG